MSGDFIELCDEKEIVYFNFLIFNKRSYMLFFILWCLTEYAQVSFL